MKYKAIKMYITVLWTSVYYRRVKKCKLYSMIKTILIKISI